jgi:hypothetical protein
MPCEAERTSRGPGRLLSFRRGDIAIVLTNSRR